MITKNKELTSIVPIEIIQNKIYLIRGRKVMFDRDLSELYGVETRVLNQAVKRNIKRFPDDFMYILTAKEVDSLRSQFVTLKRGQHAKYLPYVFTEQGVAMLSSVLNSEQAVQVNIQIMRIFTQLREMMASNKELARKIDDMEREFKGQFKEQDEKIQLVFDAIKDLLKNKEDTLRKRGPMGFTAPPVKMSSNNHENTKGKNHGKKNN